MVEDKNGLVIVRQSQMISEVISQPNGDATNFRNVSSREKLAYAAACQSSVVLAINKMSAELLAQRAVFPRNVLPRGDSEVLIAHICHGEQTGTEV